MRGHVRRVQNHDEGEALHCDTERLTEDVASEEGVDGDRREHHAGGEEVLVIQPPVDLDRLLDDLFDAAPGLVNPGTVRGLLAVGHAGRARRRATRNTTYATGPASRGSQYSARR